MLVKVTKQFTDKHTGEVHHAGKLLTITEERYNEIMSVGKLVVKIAQDDVSDGATKNTNTLSNETQETPTNDSATSGDGFELMSVRELKEYADVKYKLTFKGGMKKAEIIEELRRLEHGN